MKNYSYKNYAKQCFNNERTLAFEVFLLFFLSYFFRISDAPKGYNIEIFHVMCTQLVLKAAE